MDRIGIRELRQNASAWLRRVEEGDSFEITDHGRPVALLVPISRDAVIERLIAAGRMRRGRGNVLDLGPPLEPCPGVPLPSVLLEQDRADER
ncbi:MAG: type II toxin-antitoxin system prevent-host-death family antitoxin [Chloroflexota bacterium]|nr:type II toxin-antitoxin system prevent-host-death family antitoxin [Chloroflexota bacterium]